jgi:hypothetical protein
MFDSCMTMLPGSTPPLVEEPGRTRPLGNSALAGGQSPSTHRYPLQFYNSVTTILQECYNSATTVLQRVTAVLQQCNNSVTTVSQHWFNREQRAECREQRAESREQKAESREAPI